jgi:NitT/TauT family transport system substrate-binding protein
MAAAPPARVRMAFVTLASNTLPIWIAQDEGLFAKYGLDIELIYIAGAAKVAEALLGGDVDIAATVPVSAVGPALEGADLVLIASWANRVAFSLHVSPAVQSVADLRDKRVAVTRRGSDGEIWARSVLRQFGLEPERDYHFLAAGGQVEAVAGMQNGAFDAVVIGPPVTIRARQLGLRELLGYRDYGVEAASVGLVTSRRYLREQSDVVARLLRACAEGIALQLQQPEIALAALSRWTDTTDREVLEETLAFQETRTAREMLPSPASLQAALEDIATANPKAAGANPDDFVDLTLVRQLNDSGFIRGLYP